MASEDYSSWGLHDICDRCHRNLHGLPPPRTSGFMNSCALCRILRKPGYADLLSLDLVRCNSKSDWLNSEKVCLCYKPPSLRLKDRLHSLCNIALYSRTLNAVEKPIQFVNCRQIDFAQVKSWLEECKYSHHTVCMSRRFTEHISKSTDLLLIDVPARCIMRNDSKGTRYVALSYVWGNIDQLKLAESNVTFLTQPGALGCYARHIPQVIHDAMRVVSAIGERYLWVDSLCIINDNISEKHNQISRMASIYDGALVTIVAASAQDAKSGLPGVMPYTRRFNCFRQSNDVSIASQMETLDDYLKSPLTYQTRGWTYQEMVLSRRCLFFLDHQLFYQCQHSIQCESLSVALTQFPGIYYSRIRDRCNVFPMQPSLSAYVTMTEEYTRRTLTYSSDRLDAFAGVIGALQAAWNWAFVFGLPVNRLHQALIWIPTSYSHSPSEDQLQRMFPTWSWASVSRGVCFPVGPYGGKYVCHVSRFYLYVGGEYRVSNSANNHYDLPEQIIESPPIVGADPAFLLTFYAFSLSMDALLDRFDTRVESISSRESILSEIYTFFLRHDGGTPAAILHDWQVDARYIITDVELLLISSDFLGFSGRRSGTPYLKSSAYSRLKGHVMLIQWKGDVAQRLCVGETDLDIWRGYMHKKKSIHLI